MLKREGTVSVRDSHRFDEKALEQYLTDHLPEFSSPLNIRQFHGGQSNPTFHIATANAEYVLRKQPPGKLLPSAHAIDREYRVMNALKDSDVPVPTSHLYCEDASIIGTPFYLMDFLAGRIFSDPLLPEQSNSERAAIYDSMNDVLARLHKVDWKAAGLATYGKHENYMARQVALWSRQYLASKTSEFEPMNKLLEWLPDNIPEDGQTAIAHGDFRIGNLIFHPKKPEVIAVLDWELSTLGHPLGDLAFNCMTYDLPAGHEIAGGFVGADHLSLGIPSEQEYLAAYARRTGRDEINNWTFFKTFSLFRTAAIVQGVYARSLTGNASSANAHMFGDTFTYVAEKSFALIEKC